MVLQVDTILSLLGFAVTINSAILILASAAFYYGGNAAIRAAGANADLFEAHQLITQQISKGKRAKSRQIFIIRRLNLENMSIAAAFVFALALLCVSTDEALVCGRTIFNLDCLTSAPLIVRTKRIRHCNTGWRGRQRGLHRMEDKREFSPL